MDRERSALKENCGYYVQTASALRIGCVPLGLRLKKIRGPVESWERHYFVTKDLQSQVLPGTGIERRQQALRHWIARGESLGAESLVQISECRRGFLGTQPTDL